MPRRSSIPTPRARVARPPAAGRDPGRRAGRGPGLPARLRRRPACPADRAGVRPGPGRAAGRQLRERRRVPGRGARRPPVEGARPVHAARHRPRLAVRRPRDPEGSRRPRVRPGHRARDRPRLPAGRCRLWVAAAGGGIWRTTDALAPKPTWIAPDDEPAHDRVRLAPLRRRRTTCSTRARGAERLRVTPRPASACSARRRRRALDAAARQRQGGDQPLDRGDRRRPPAPAHHLHRHRRRPPRFRVRQRRPADAAERSDARRLPLDRRRCAPSPSRRTSAAGPRRTRHPRCRDRVGLVPGRGQPARARPQRPRHALRGRPGLRRVARGPEQAGPDLVAGLPHHEPDQLQLRRQATSSVTGRSSTSSTWRTAGPAPMSATPPTTGRSTVTTPRRRRRPGATTTWRPITGQPERQPRQRGERLDRAVQLRARHQRLRRLQLLPERPVRLRLPGRASRRGLSGHGLVPRLDELRRAAGVRPVRHRRAAALQRAGRSARPTPVSPPSTRHRQDMTAVLESPVQAWGVREGIHPDLHAAVFARRGDIAFIGSDGGVVRIDTSTTRDQSSLVRAASLQLRLRQPAAAPTLLPDDRFTCRELLRACRSR